MGLHLNCQENELAGNLEESKDQPTHDYQYSIISNKSVSTIDKIDVPMRRDRVILF